MDAQNKHLESLAEIRSIMEKSSRFISLSGLSGVFAGVFALIGAGAAYFYLNISINSRNYYDYAYLENGETNYEFYKFFIINATLVLVFSLVFGFYFTKRKAKKNNVSVWDSSSKRLLINLMIPLVTGGLFGMILLYHGLVGLIAPITLLFYGLALLNASKYTLNDIRYLGISEIVLGLLASIYIGYGLLFWAIGFGVLHIVYGVVMYFKYER
jgi:general stress protein CsbA